jgi:hypothetical protein
VIPSSPFGYGQFVRGYYHCFFDFVYAIIKNDKSGRFLNDDVRTWVGGGLLVVFCNSQRESASFCSPHWFSLP